MPEISRFLGIVIAMFYMDHNPPHFHAYYGARAHQPLQDAAYFRSFTLSPDLHTVVWPNGADLAPEFLHERVRIPV